MAKDAKQKKGKSKGKGRKGSRINTIIFGLIGSLVLIYFLSFAALLVILGMLPSFVAGYVDRTPDRSRMKVVTACNLAGITPFVIDLLMQGQITSSNVHAILLSGYTWFVILMSAGTGWALVWGFPRASHAVLEFMQNSNIAALRKRQQQIIDEWGQDVEMTASRALKNSAYKDDKSGDAADAGGTKAVAQLPAPKK